MTVQILKGDCRDVLKGLPDESVHCVVTSPPYFGLRDYGIDGQIGREANPISFVAELAAIFQDVRRVLRSDGVAWVNLGDTYASAWPCSRRNVIGEGALANGKREARPPRMGADLKEKDLIGIPWAVAFALRADGWYLRQDIIWSKPNPMPESVTDRCTKAHEYLFLLSKSARYFYDAEAIKEPAIYSGLTNQDESCFKDPRSFNGKHKDGYHSSGDEPLSFKGSKFNNGKTAEHQLGRSSSKPRKLSTWQDRKAVGEPMRRGDPGQSGHITRTATLASAEGRNKRSVWTVPTSPYADAHFATFPPALIEPCILAGCPKGGTVLDPFGGAGTTGMVADRNGRNAILIELNPEYADMAERRIKGDAGMFVEVATA